MSSSIYSASPGAGNIRAGVVSATVNGEAIDVASDATYDATQWKRETLVGQSGVQGFSKNPKVGKIGFTVRDAGTLTVQSFNNMENATVVLQLANGKTVTGDGMWEASDGIEVNTQDGTFKVNFEGPQVVES
jgi:Phage tail tube protein